MSYLHHADGDAYPLDHDDREDDEEHREDREGDGDVFQVSSLLQMEKRVQISARRPS